MMKMLRSLSSQERNGDTWEPSCPANDDYDQGTRRAESDLVDRIQIWVNEGGAGDDVQ
jgi:hypothetical protein